MACRLVLRAARIVGVQRNLGSDQIQMYDKAVLYKRTLNSTFRRKRSLGLSLLGF
jgi:hypothetical protein